MVLSMERWVGKVAIVTGTSSGIGAGIAKALVENGMIVAGLARRKDRVDKLAKELQGAKGKLHAVTCDVTKEEDILKAFQWVSENLGPVHVLINNAGVMKAEKLSEGNTETWRQIFVWWMRTYDQTTDKYTATQPTAITVATDIFIISLLLFENPVLGSKVKFRQTAVLRNTNVIGLSIATREAVKTMKSNKIDGHIIHINSIVGHMVPSIDLPVGVYPASKYAVTALAEILKQELIREELRIKITSISPGGVSSELLESSGIKQEELLKGHVLFPEDVADSVVYALSTPPHVQVKELIVQAVGEAL